MGKHAPAYFFKGKIPGPQSLPLPLLLFAAVSSSSCSHLTKIPPVFVSPSGVFSYNLMNNVREIILLIFSVVFVVYKYYWFIFRGR